MIILYNYVDGKIFVETMSQEMMFIKNYNKNLIKIRTQFKKTMISKVQKVYNHQFLKVLKGMLFQKLVFQEILKKSNFMNIY